LPQEAATTTLLLNETAEAAISGACFEAAMEQEPPASSLAREKEVNIPDVELSATAEHSPKFIKSILRMPVLEISGKAHGVPTRRQRRRGIIKDD